MGLIGKIRKNSWFLLVFLGMALAAFVLMDILDTSGRYDQAGSNEIGKVNGITIDANEFLTTESVLFGNSPQENAYANKATLWNYFKNKVLVGSMAEKIGLGVSNDELMDLQFGQNLSQIIQSRYRDPQTGMVDRAQLEEVKNAIQTGQLVPEYRRFWAIQEEEIIHERLQTKMLNLVSKALYTPGWYAEDLGTLNRTNASFAYVKVPFESVNDSDVEVSDSDIKDYIARNKKTYTNTEESRIVKYIEMPVMPTGSDMDILKGEIEKLREDFAATENDSLFAIMNRGSFSNVYYSRGDLPEQLRQDTIGLTKGQLIGPYTETSVYTIAKILDVRVVPDSVKASHILIQVQPGDVTGMVNAENKIDSIRQVVLSGSSAFDALAREHSQDPGSAASGGELGTFPQGMMVADFNHACFISGKKGDYVKVKTQFGVHLIYIEDQIFNDREPKYKVAYVTRPIEPSDETQNNAYVAASQFITDFESVEKLEMQATELGYEIKTSQELRENDFSFADLEPGGTSRQIIQWAFNEATKKGSISPTVYSVNNRQYAFVEKYVIALLDHVIPEGLRKVEDARLEVEPLVRNEKKARMIAEQMGNNPDIRQVADQFQVSVDSVNMVNYETRFVMDIGNEPKVMSIGFNGEINKSYGPVIGNNGVFVVMPMAVQKPFEAIDVIAEKRNQTNKVRMDLASMLFRELEKKVKIEDNRRKFF